MTSFQDTPTDSSNYILVEPENGNRFDLFAMKVMMPTLVNKPPYLHQEVTRPESQRHSHGPSNYRKPP